MDFITLALILILVVVLFNILRERELERRKLAEKIDVFGGEKYYPIIGTTWGLLKAGRKNFFKAYLERNAKNGPLFRSWMGRIPQVHVMKPEHIEIILSSTENVRKGVTYRFVRPWLGEGLITSGDRDKWFFHRKLITPTFHFKILDQFTKVFSEEAQKLATLLQGKADGEFFDVFPYLTHCALDIICDTAMGVKLNSMENSSKSSAYVTSIYEVTELVLTRMFNPFLHNDLIYSLTSNGRRWESALKVLHGITRTVIKDRQQIVNKNISNRRELTEEEKLMGGKQRSAFLDLLIEEQIKNGSSLTLEEIREEVDTFMFAGHDTTTATTCWTLFAVANYPAIQEKVHEELDSIFHGEERPITPEDLNKMKYLERVIKEVLRVHTIVPAVVRALDKEIIIDGKPIPPGVQIVVHIKEVHHNPEQFPNPEVFDPDRFLPENTAKRHPYAYIPFSAGPRNCLGQKFALRNARCIVASILRKYSITAKNTPQDIECYNEIVVKPQNGMLIALKEREV